MMGPNGDALLGGGGWGIILDIIKEGPDVQGPVVRSTVSANHWLSSIKINRLSWYLTLVSANQASSTELSPDRIGMSLV